MVGIVRGCARTLPAVVTGKAEYRDFRKFETKGRMIRK
jgi:hypothetical protein